jgi:hypothetical protein
MTIRPLLLAGTPTCLFELIRRNVQSNPGAKDQRLLSSLIKALRNVLTSTGDLAWGHIHGAVVPREIVSTGLARVPSRDNMVESGRVTAELLPNITEVLSMLFWVC